MPLDRLSMELLILVLLAACALLCTAAASAPAVAAPSLADQATDDALQRLFDKVMELRVVTGQTAQSIAALLASSAEVNRQLRQAIHDKKQIGRPRRTDNGQVETDVGVSIGDLQEAVRQIAAEHLPALAATPPVLDPSAGPAVFATGRALPDGRPRDPRPGWRHCEPTMLALTRAAAREDLTQRLLARIGRVPLPNRQTIGHLLRQYPGFEKSLRARVASLPLTEPTFEPIGLYVQSLTLSEDQLVGILHEAAGDAADKIEVDFAKAVAAALRPPITIEGFAVPPPIDRSAMNVDAPAPTARPDWADRYLSAKAVGQAPPGVADLKAQRELAAKAARIEAKRQLWMELEKLTLPDGDTVARSLINRPDRAEAVAAVNQAIFPMATPTFDNEGVATVTLGLRLETVWQVVGSR